MITSTSCLQLSAVTAWLPVTSHPKPPSAVSMSTLSAHEMSGGAPVRGVVETSRGDCLSGEGNHTSCWFGCSTRSDSMTEEPKAKTSCTQDFIVHMVSEPVPAQGWVATGWPSETCGQVDDLA
jgi:hypothetical protein